MSLSTQKHERKRPRERSSIPFSRPAWNDPCGVSVLLDPSLAEHPDFHDGWGAIRERCVPMLDESSRRRASIFVTDVDHERLASLLERYRHEARPRDLATLRAQLAEAEIVSAPRVPPHVVTMNSRVLCRDEMTRALTELTLVYPDEALGDTARLSVLSRLGSRLLGTSVGACVELSEQRDCAPRWRVTELPYQPEREGHFHL